MNLHYVFASDRQTDRVAAASQRLITAAKRKKRINRDAYYGDGPDAPPEPVDHNAQIENAVITRNHYGSLVLNASRALFIDVDMGESVEPLVPVSTYAWDDTWQSTLDDLCTVLASEKGEGFRIYQTAAGFRVLATTHEYEPTTPASSRLMNLVGADADFVKLCRIQNSFRARLTPKPWRCGSRRPPTIFQCLTDDEKYQYATWLTQYERACSDRATCRFLEHVGSSASHRRIAPLVELHDRVTKAFQGLPLA